MAKYNPTNVSCTMTLEKIANGTHDKEVIVGEQCLNFARKLKDVPAAIPDPGEMEGGLKCDVKILVQDRNSAALLDKDFGGQQACQIIDEVMAKAKIPGA